MRRSKRILGEYIIQLRHEPPSHIIAPAIHLSKEQVADAFREHHADYPAGRPLEEPRVMLDEARTVLRRKFLEAEVGITGANMLIAETGSIVLVTNEGNGDLTQTLPRVQIVIASIEKVVPTLEDASTILRLLARSATGQDLSVYTTFTTGPKRPEDLDGPPTFHVLLLDNGRTADAGQRVPRDAPLHPLRCLHQPLPDLRGDRRPRLWLGLLRADGGGADPQPDRHRGSAAICRTRQPCAAAVRRSARCAFRCRGCCASCASGSSRRTLTAKPVRWGLAGWAFLAQRPALYQMAMRIGVGALALLGRKRGRFRSLPLASGWTSARDLPAPQGQTFQQLWSAQGGRRQ